MKKLLLTLMFLIGLSSQAQAQNLLATVNRTDIPVGETFLLTLTYDGSKTSNSPDLANLEQDFKVYSVSNALQTSFVNGQMSQKQQWQIALMPKTTGNISIPAIKLGQVESNPINLNIVEATSANPTPDTADNNKLKFSMNGKISNDNPYVQQQVNYTLTLYDTGGLEGNEPTFLDNAQNDWIIKKLSEPMITTKIINGKTIREIIFEYALFPQKSGKLVVPSVQFNGYYLSKARGAYDPFEEVFGGNMNAGFGFSDMFATRTPLVLKTKPIEIEVKPIALNNNGNWWLPSTEVSLFASFEPSKPTFRVGEAVNRTIYLKALGVIDSQLPNIKFSQVEGLKQYPEKALTENKVEDGELVSIKKISNVYIPNKEGRISLPEISVDWFNVKTNRIEKSTLPALNINVLPSNNTTQLAPIAEEQKIVENNNIEQRGEKIKDIAEETEEVFVQQVKLNQPYAIIVLAFFAGIIVTYLILRPRRNNADKENVKITDYKKFIIKKAKDHDIRGIRDALITWAAQHYNDDKITNLKEVEKYAKNKEFSTEIEKLMVQLYSNNNTNWDSDSFITAFEKVAAKKQLKKTKKPLPELYDNK